MNTPLKNAKAQYKHSIKNRALYQKNQKLTAMQILDTKTPNWGGIQVSLLKNK